MVFSKKKTFVHGESEGVAEGRLANGPGTIVCSQLLGHKADRCNQPNLLGEQGEKASKQGCVLRSLHQLPPNVKRFQQY